MKKSSDKSSGNTFLFGILAAGLELFFQQNLMAENLKTTTARDSLEQLGIKDESQQSSFLDILRLSGNLEKDKIWIAEYKVLKFKGMQDKGTIDKSKNTLEQNEDVKKELDIFNSINKCLLSPNNKEIMSCKIKELTNTELTKIFIWLSQNAFNRSVGQERYEITGTKTESKEVLEKFFIAAKQFGLVDEILPQRSKYDHVVIPGASNESMSFRILTYKYFKNLGKIKSNNVTILAGEREAWFEIDKISEQFLSVADSSSDSHNKDSVNFTSNAIEKIIELRKKTEQGDVVQNYDPNFLVELAKQNGINLKEPNLIKYSDKNSCPQGKFPNRTYLNYEDGENKKVTETTIANYLLNRYLGKEFTENSAKISTKIIDAKLIQSESVVNRPTTESTAKDFAAKIAFSINQDLENGNVDAASYRLPYFAGSSYFSKNAIESEFAATLAEYFKTSQYNGFIEQNVELKELLFQSRDNSEPNYYAMDIVGEN